MKCYVFDIDGTLACAEHRLHHIQKAPKDWDGFFADMHLDQPHAHIVELALHLQKHAPLVFCSGRPARWELVTRAWLAAQGFRYNDPLFMRSTGDRRDDDIVKCELLDQIIQRGYQPIMAFDDRNRVVAMWRSRGIPCAQVAEGNF